MMDHFKEEVVISRKRFLNDLMYIFCWMLVVIFGLNAFVMLQGVMFSFSVSVLVMALLSGAAAAVLFFFKDNFKTEYEYSFTNGSLDFAKVLRSARRKELGSMNVANVAACGHVAHQSFQKFLAMKDVNKRNWFLNRDAELLYFYFQKENQKRIIIIEPSEEMISLIKRNLPQGIWQVN
jgi:hypothetical protein